MLGTGHLREGQKRRSGMPRAWVCSRFLVPEECIATSHYADDIEHERGSLGFPLVKNVSENIVLTWGIRRIEIR